jgi:predicted pyridoxine 5'-phosphate oxidase superfamily flavin-nucleotide-binding protein
MDAVKAAFDSIKLIKGQIISVGTCDADGNPNVAPVGSVRIVDDRTVHLIQGELGRTMKNLKANPRAVFSVVTRPKLRALLKDKDQNLGYRVYGRFTGVDESKEAVRDEADKILSRLPFLLRRSFRGFVEKNLKRVLEFEITSVRAVS